MWGSSDNRPSISRTSRDLPMPGSPASSTTWPSPSLGPLPAIEQQRHLLLPADKRREARSLTRLEAALRAAFSSDPPRHDRLGEALELLRAEVSELEQPPDQPARRLTDHQVPWFGKRLEAGG